VLLRETCFHDYSGYVLPRPLRGIIPPLVTPLAGPDALDLPGLDRLVGRVVEAGCAGVFVLGSTGEAQALSYRLRMEMVRATYRVVAGRVPVLAGVTDTSVVEAVRFGRAAMDAGCDAVVTAQPYYFRVSQRDLLRHAEMLVRDIGAPLFLYNMPGLTKLTYEPETVAAAAEIDGIIGFKDSSGDLIYFQRVLRAVAGKPEFTVLIGPEELLPQAVQLGAHGGIAGGANLRPRLYVDLYRAAAEGGWDHVAELQQQVLELSERVYHVGDAETSYIRGLKGALELEGVCSGLPAPPLLPLDDRERALISAPVLTA
jgi:dihydrodipicolinate synthase/N-acetylneuraminate lyase